MKRLLVYRAAKYELDKEGENLHINMTPEALGCYGTKSV